MSAHYSPGQYGHEPMIDPLHFALYRAWQYLSKQKFDGNDRNGGVPCEGNGERLLVESPSTISAMEWIRSGAPVPTERPRVIAEDLYRKKFNLAPRRL